MREEKSYLRRLGWDPGTTGELDHREVSAPYIRLSSWKMGDRGDSVYLFDIRMTQPNVNFLSSLQLHSIEHFLLAGLRKHLPHAFVNVAPMGCQTGFYLVTINEGRATAICEAYQNTLLDILSATSVPYANIKDCGQHIHHNLKNAQVLAESLLACQSDWLNIMRTAA